MAPSTPAGTGLLIERRYGGPRTADIKKKKEKRKGQPSACRTADIDKQKYNRFKEKITVSTLDLFASF